MLRRNLLLTIIILVASYGIGWSQLTSATIENVDFLVDGTNIVVTYDIENAPVEERYQIEVKFVMENKNIIVPKTLSGDVGYSITGGKYKKITWDALKDVEEVKGKLKAVVTVLSVSNTKYQYIGGGPANSLLSVVIPGWGDWLVRKDQSKGKPFILITLATYGSLTVWGVAKVVESIQLTNYQDAMSQDDMDYYYEKANNWHYHAGRASRIAFAIWGADVVAVFFKGIRNNSIKNKYHLTSNSSVYHDYNLGYNPIAQGPEFTYRIRF